METVTWNIIKWCDKVRDEDDDDDDDDDNVLQLDQ